MAGNGCYDATFVEIKENRSLMNETKLGFSRHRRTEVRNNVPLPTEASCLSCQ